jgi:ribonuclease Z
MIRVTFLGTGGALPSVIRNVSGVMVEREGESLLFDCGEGIQRQMMRYGVGFQVDDIYFSHYHADHTLGLPGLLRTMGMQGRTAPIRLHGPTGAELHLGELVHLGRDRAKFPIEIVTVQPGDRLDRGEYEVVVAEAVHKGPAVSYALVERDRLGRFDPERARALGIPEGPLWGKIHKGESVTLEDSRVVSPAELVGPTRPGRTVVYSGDTAPSNFMLTLADGADLLIHEATFGEDEKDRAIETRHSTAREAAEQAQIAGVRRLVLTHISARYSREAPELLAEAQAEFPETVVAQDGMVIEVPYREQ